VASLNGELLSVASLRPRAEFEGNLRGAAVKSRG